MPLAVQCVPLDRHLSERISGASSLLWLCSPFVTAEGVEAVLRSAARSRRLITKATAANLASRSLDARALVRFLEAGGEVRSIPNLHAKIYLIDGRDGVVTSSNLTASGLYQNVELGVTFTDEAGLYHAVEAVFSRLWSRATPVSVAALQGLEDASRGATPARGVWARPSSDRPDEPLVPAPAIGYLDTPPQVGDVSAAAHAPAGLEEPDPVPTPDESGDLLGPLPESGAPLIRRLRSGAPSVAQLALNALVLTSPADFRSWLDRLPASEINLLAEVSNPYPYKTRVVERVIQDGSPHAVAAAIRSLTADADNESQFVKYLPGLEARLLAGPTEERVTLARLLLGVAEQVAQRFARSTLEKKNFTRPNFDRLCNTVAGARLGPEIDAAVAAARTACVAPSAQALDRPVPSFQAIKRARESMGDGFGEWAFGHIAAIEAGLWDDHLPSVMSLFKELRKVGLGPAGQARVAAAAHKVLGRLDTNAANRRPAVLSAADDWERSLAPAWKAEKSTLLAAARAELQPQGRQAVRATGRWVSLYGQAVKGDGCPAHQPLKTELDWMTTYLSVRSTLTSWADSKSRTG